MRSRAKRAKKKVRNTVEFDSWLVKILKARMLKSNATEEQKSLCRTNLRLFSIRVETRTGKNQLT